MIKVAIQINYHQHSFFLQILAGSNDIIKWVDTNIDTEVNTITQNTLVPGGYQHYYGKVYEYIGRIKNNFEVFVGRAMLDTKDLNVRGLQLIYNNNEVYTIVLSGFQVLTVINKSGCVF